MSHRLQRITGALLLLVAGCGARSTAGSSRVDATFEQAATARAAVALDCPEWGVRAEHVGGGGVVVNGCGMRQSYTCTTTIVSVRHVAVCAPDGPPVGTHGPPVGTDPHIAVDASDDERVALSALGPCQLPPGATVTFAVGVDGDVLQSSSDPDTAARCVAERLRGATFAHRADATQVVVTLPDETAPPAPPPPPPSSAPVASAADEAAARVAIDGLRDLVLACTGGAAVAVVGDWQADGALVVHLPDARAGTAEDGCVRAASAGARLPSTPSAAGTILHALH